MIRVFMEWSIFSSDPAELRYMSIFVNEDKSWIRFHEWVVSEGKQVEWEDESAFHGTIDSIVSRERQNVVFKENREPIFVQ